MMRRVALPVLPVPFLLVPILLLLTAACSSPDLSARDTTPATEFEGTGFAKFIADTHTFAANPNLPDGDALPDSYALNMLRVMAIATPVEPLSTEEGTIWPGPPEPIKSLRDLQMEASPAIAPEPRLPSSRQLGEGIPGAAYTPAPRTSPSAVPSSAAGPTVLTNADGSKTLIYPDGRVEFRAAPK